MYSTMWTDLTGTTVQITNSTTTAAIPNYDPYILPDVQVKTLNNPAYSVPTAKLSKFPFKKNKYKGLSDQLQGDFDKWAGKAHKIIFS